MTIEHLTTHGDDAPELLLGQFQGKPRILALLLSFIDQIQVLEDAIWSVIVGRLIDDAEGVQLDALGRIVGQPRAGHDDDTYRLYLRARIAINISHGHADDVINVMRIVEAAPHKLYEFWPATLLIEFQGPTTADPDVLFDLANQARAGGVRLMLTWGEDIDDSFQYSTLADSDDEDDRTSFALIDESTGGYLSGVVQ